MKIAEIQEKVCNLIEQAVQKAITLEKTEKQNGKILQNNPVARLLLSPSMVNIGETMLKGYLNAQIKQNIAILDKETLGIIHGLFVTGETKYLTSRRQWVAYKPACELLQANGIEDETLLYNLFHYVPGAMVFIRNRGKILIGVRSANLAGTHAGMISFPAGMIAPYELVEEAARRELGEETGLTDIKFEEVFAPVRNPDAPSTTFCVEASTNQTDVKSTFEMKGKKFIWVSFGRVLHPAIRGEMQPLIDAFAAQSIDIGREPKIAPDALAGLKIFYPDFI